ncbi:non-ribosomal peptide synthetase [Massilia pseudoviolaceinigra]|uniref:non-ribosomal peptide synthetase n=1 Tax=Massilia pseudoviolaceinigra TaxID=3057165 RepID=UPI002796574A|nr:non-ribosomal peptide synthetase [Massilia sp. CCM 9206]MDQ1919267.1 amino acid adenylation domain-containing protein [Massilia sp. CCM 9206]
MMSMSAMHEIRPAQTDSGMAPGGLPLSVAQQGVWIAQQLDPSNPRYNCGGYLDIDGALDLAILDAAARLAVQETQALRVRFSEHDGGVRQTIEDVPPQTLTMVDLSAERDPHASAAAWMRNDLGQAADFGAAPLFKQVIFTLGPDRHQFYLRYHHIVMDGFAQTRYWSRLGQLYTALRAGSMPPATPYSSLDTLLDEEAAYRASPQHARDRAYWTDAFASHAEPARLSGVASMASSELLRRTVTLPARSIGHLRSASSRGACRWSVLVLAATAAYLQRVTGNDNVVLGLPVTGRMTPAALDTPAMMANELPLRLALPASLTIAELLVHVSVQVGRVLKHQRYRGEELHQALKLSGTSERLTGPTVNVISFDHQVRFGEHDTTAHYLSSGPVNDLLIGFYGKSDGSGLQIYFDANPDLYTSDELAAHQQRFVHFLDTFLLAEPGQALGQLNLLMPGEHAQLLSYNATARDYDLSPTLHQLIDEQARRTPDAVAIAVAGASMRYGELIDASDRLAAHLCALGAVPGQRVGVCDVRSLELVVSLLAVMKAGAAYVPLDPDLPPARLAYQVDNAGLALVLTRSTLAGLLESLPVRTVAVDQVLAGLPPAAAGSLPAATPECAAYVIYTSGSTGQPKGVAVPHRGVVNRLLWMQETYRLGISDCVLQKTPFTFDVSVWEFFWPLLAGCKLFLAEPGGHRDPRYLADTIVGEGVTTLHFVPPMLELFLEQTLPAMTSLRRVFCSGEALRPDTVGAFFAAFAPETANVDLLNLYGPTEASIDVTAWHCRPQDAQGAVPIGYPVANTQIYLLDASGAPAPAGVPGELYIGGVQVALGYVNQPQLSAERFVPNPFAPGLMYRSGDLARYRKDGAIEFLGRLDHQVKLRGFRIELGEIEAALLANPAVRQTVVVVWDRSARERRLVAYVAPAAGAPADLESMLLADLARQLPEYMVPSHIVMLDQLPLSSNGKIDRRALPVPQVDTGVALALPTTQAERVLLAVWRELLETEQIGVDQSFFALGGDSMLSIRMRVALERQGYTFAIADLFAAPTIAALAARLQPFDRHAPARAPAPPFALLRPDDRARLPDGLEDAYPLSAMQGGMLFHADFDADSAVYRVVTSLHIGAPLDVDALRAALADTFRRHPALRSSFDLSRYSEPLQLVHAQVEVPFELADDLGAHDPDGAARTIAAWVEQAKFFRFDLSAAPLLRFTVHPRGPASFQLSVLEHHVVLDGWSDASLLQEIVNRYRARLAGQELFQPAIASLYRDFVAEERRIMGEPAARDFWTTMLRGAEPTLLPRKTLQQGAQRATRQQAFEVPLRAGLGEQLRQLARQHGLPLKALLAAAHVALLRMVCNSNEVLTGVVSNARLEAAGGDQVIGVFLNTLPLRVDCEGASLLALAGKVFEHERQAAPYKRYPFGQIQRDLGGQLQLDSYVNFMDFHLDWQAGRGADNIVLDSLGVAETNIALAANFLVDPVQGGLRFWLDCDVALLDADLCERLPAYYARALEALADHPGQDACALDLMSGEEHATIARWNATESAYDRAATVHGLVALQAAWEPHAPAAAHRWENVDYAELEARANRMARELRQRGVRRGSLVGVSLRRGSALLVSLLAIMKAGGAYVPLDPAFPPQRLAYIAGDAGIDCLVTERGGPSNLDCPQVLLVDLDAASIAAQPDTPLVPDSALDAGPDDAAYVIYTSGSTGLPKGTLIRHRNVINFFAGMDARIPCAPGTAVLAVTSVSFDISVLELLWPLTRGARVVIAAEHIIGNLARDEADRRRMLRHALLLPTTPASWGAAAIELAAANNWPVLPDGLRDELRWIAAGADVAAYADAGARRVAIIAPLPGQSLEELAARTAAYRAAGGTSVTVAVPCVLPGDADMLHALAAAGADCVAYQPDAGAAPEIVMAELSGIARLAALHDAECADSEHTFADLCKRHNIDVMQGTPSLLAAVAAEPAALAALSGASAVLVGGEAFPVGLAARLLAALPATRVFNMYGPTETTIWSTVHELVRGKDTLLSGIPIGTPIANTQVLVLDCARRPVPVGVAGELWIGGDGVSGVYLNRPELSAERFPVLGDAGAQVYRTGDRVRWRSDGALEFLGRVDRQVKILGHRVEPDEVESVLSTHPQVASVAVVAVVKESGTAELVAFVAPSAALVDRAAEAGHIARWGALWDGAYAEAEGQHGEEKRLGAHDFAGWLSSYDNAPIPLAQMREWLGHAVRGIDRLAPSRMLDVGVGVGLFLREFAPRVDAYTGLDVSPAALRSAQASLRLPGGLPAHIVLREGDATCLEQIAAGSADTVVINSVIQYFPGTDYLDRVLRDAVRIAGPTGAVFVGDVRDAGLLEAFHASVQLHRAPALMPARDIASVLARQLAAEAELCLPTAFFRRWPGARLELKRGHAENELNCFRFDVVLPGADRTDGPVSAPETPWAGMAALEAALQAGPAALRVTGIPNQRLVRPLKLVELLREADGTATAWDLEKALWEHDDGSAVDPEQVAELAESFGFAVRLMVGADGRMDRFDALIEGQQRLKETSA